MVVLVGDIGGTKTHLATADMVSGQVRLARECRYVSRDYPGLEDILRLYLSEHLSDLAQRPAGAAFAIAGPVADDRSDATNLPWHLDARALEAATGIAQVGLLNDLEAIAWSIAGLDETQRLAIQSGDSAARGNIAVVAPGTGLGQAGLFWDGQSHRPFATEGGHTDFAPTNALEFALLEHLQRRYGHVSWERIASGMGIENLYEFLHQHRGATHHPRMQETLVQQGDVAAAVSMLAAGGECAICQEVMDWFAQLLGRETGNVALKLMARGGVYLAGGILPKNLDLIRGSGFLQGFVDKGRMSGLLKAMPVHLIVEERSALIGAAHYLNEQRIR
ncbi:MULTISPECIES: glucokinase [Thiorhodovibrio]|uniref:glucokinase n=1 Tax=Thiorhodovibrio TaxID=61593 RepID=UPI001913BB8E|nr:MULTISPECIES: glucokinase [Thiorhodovibrio]MBK5968592.1 glucokinase [Thiorhodovibrio winogradskyi]WPL11311.1 Glucokinase [Thiorhodovibrio litoralis]